MKTELEQNIKTLKERPKNRVRGVIFFTLGTLVLIDSPSPFPIPLTGLPSVMAACLILSYGIYNLYFGLRLPLKEVLSLIASRGGQVTVEEVLEFCGDEVTNADQLLRVLERKNLVLRATRSLDYVESHDEVPDNLLVLTDNGRKRLKIPMQSS